MRKLQKSIPFLNTIQCGDSARLLKQIQNNSIDLIITSPPYFQQREYGGGQIGSEKHVEDYIDALMDVFRECVRIVKNEGNIVFNLGDKYENASLLLVPYKFTIQATHEEKVKLVNEITWIKTNPTPRQFKRRLVNSTEPFFHFVKTNNYYYDPDSYQNQNKKKLKKSKKSKIGERYKILIKKSNLTKDQKRMANDELQQAIDDVKNGELFSLRMKIKGIHSAAFGGQSGGRKIQMEKNGFTVIRLPGDSLKRDTITSSVESLKWNKHPSIYPQKIILELIKLLCPKNGIVLDPYMGSGTTAVCAKKINRDFIGIDINPEFCLMATERINQRTKEN